MSGITLLAPGDRTDTFHRGHDQLLIGADGICRISVEDYAVAMLDELAQPAHRRQRFTVGD